MPNDLPIREPDQIRQDCVRKLRAVASQRSLPSDPWLPAGGRLDHTPVDRNGHHTGRPPHLLGRCDGETTFKVFLGASADLIKNIHGVAPVAELDGDEIGFLVAKVVEIKRQR